MAKFASLCCEESFQLSEETPHLPWSIISYQSDLPRSSLLSSTPAHQLQIFPAKRLRV